MDKAINIVALLTYGTKTANGVVSLAQLEFKALVVELEDLHKSFRKVEAIEIMRNTYKGD